MRVPICSTWVEYEKEKQIFSNIDSIVCSILIWTDDASREVEENPHWFQVWQQNICTYSSLSYFQFNRELQIIQINCQSMRKNNVCQVSWNLVYARLLSIFVDRLKHYFRIELERIIDFFLLTFSAWTNEFTKTINTQSSILTWRTWTFVNVNLTTITSKRRRT